MLFLDVDGVLNNHQMNRISFCGEIHKDKIEMINELNVKIVLSSAWRYLILRNEMNLVGLNWLFRSHGLRADSIIDIIDSDNRPDMHWDGKSQSWVVEHTRGELITKWIKDHRYDGRYVVVDDLDLGIKDAKHPFVQTDGTVGLTWDHVAKIKELLK